MTDNFLQFSANRSQGRNIGGRQHRPYASLEQFKSGDGTHYYRPSRVISYTLDNNNLDIIVEAKKFENRIMQTHETTFNQYTEIKCEDLYFHVRISVWSDTTFRIQYGVSSDRQDYSTVDTYVLNKSELEHKMLCGVGESNIDIKINEKDKSIELSTKSITINVQKEKFFVSAQDKNGKTFYKQRDYEVDVADVRSMGIAQGENGYVAFESLDLGYDDEIFGLGERFDYVNRRGKNVDFWNKDAIGTSHTRSYINVPFWMSTAGYGIFLNSCAYTEWELGTKEFCTAEFGIDEGLMDYFVIYGPSPDKILYNYSRLTGFAEMPPEWSFGLWMSRNSYLSWEVVNEVADEIRRRDIPCDVLHLDSAWFKEDWNCDLKFSQERFANPEEEMKKLREKGFRISLWQLNFIPNREDNENYQVAKRNGYFAAAKTKSDKYEVFQYPANAVGSWVDDGIIDFSNPKAYEWYKNLIKDLIKKGAAAIKVDFGEGIPEDAIYFGIDGSKFHNLYSLIYTKAIAEATYEVSGENITFTRCGTAGSQRYPIHWGGDSQCSWQGLAGTLKAALSIGLSGFPFFAHDIGGFIGRPSPELYLRWAQFGLFSSHSRCHGCGNDNSREPWAFGEEVEDIFRKFAKMRYSMMPYILEQAKISTLTGKPMVRAMYIDYYNDRQTWNLENQYMFGDKYLIAPILEPISQSRTRNVYLPKGRWKDVFTSNIFESSGQWYQFEVTLDKIPMLEKM